MEKMYTGDKSHAKVAGTGGWADLTEYVTRSFAHNSDALKLKFDSTVN